MALSPGKNNGISGYITVEGTDSSKFYVEAKAHSFSEKVQTFTYKSFGDGKRWRNIPTGSTAVGSATGFIMVGSNQLEAIQNEAGQIEGWGTLTITYDTGRTVTETVMMRNIAINYSSFEHGRPRISFDWIATGYSDGVIE